MSFIPLREKKLNRFAGAVCLTTGSSFTFGFPTRIQVEPTNRCNLSCRMCPRTWSKPPEGGYGDMSGEQFQSILEQIPTLHNIQLSGYGEPLLNPDFVAMVQMASRRGIRVETNTNGHLLDGKMGEALITAGLTRLKISLDAATAETYTLIRGAGLNQVVENVKRLVELKKSCATDYPHIIFNVVVMEENIRELFLLVKLGEQLGIDAVRFKPLNCFDLEKVQSSLGQEEIITILEEQARKSLSFRLQVNWSEIVSQMREAMAPRSGELGMMKQSLLRCYSPWYECFIAYDGSVRPCCEFYDHRLDLGNVFIQPFAEIWNGEVYRSLRHKFKTGDGYNTICHRCNRFQGNIDIANRLLSLRRRLGPLRFIIR